MLLGTRHSIQSTLYTHTHTHTHTHHWVLLCCCSITQSCPTLCDPTYSTLGFPVLHELLEFAQTRVHWVGDAIQLSHLLLSPSLLAFNLSQHQGLLQWVGSSPVHGILQARYWNGLPFPSPECCFIEVKLIYNNYTYFEEYNLVFWNMYIYPWNHSVA